MCNNVSQLQTCQPLDAAAMFNLWFVLAYLLLFVALHVPSLSCVFVTIIISIIVVTTFYCYYYYYYNFYWLPFGV